MNDLDVSSVTLAYSDFDGWNNPEPFNPRQYKPISNISTTLSPDNLLGTQYEDIFCFGQGVDKSTEVYLFDRTPHISLGQGAWQYIRVMESICRRALKIIPARKTILLLSLMRMASTRQLRIENNSKEYNQEEAMPAIKS